MTLRITHPDGYAIEIAHDDGAQNTVAIWFQGLIIDGAHVVGLEAAIRWGGDAVMARRVVG